MWYFIMNGRGRVLVLCVLLYLTLISAQEIAEMKCMEYRRLPQSFIRIEYGIIGGTLTQNNEFPHMVALGYGREKNWMWLCGGSIISENFILTAAHCISNKELGLVKVVRMGVKNLKKYGSIDIPVGKIIRHPEYKKNLHYNDIALLQLKRNIIFTPSMMPACLYTEHNVNVKNNKVVATGWGLVSNFQATSNLRKVELRIYPHQICQQNYMNVARSKLENGINDSTQICAGGGPGQERDTCQGDSGGPLVMKTSPLYTLVGVTSFGKVCGTPNVPGVYTRVSAFIPWIEQHVW